MHPDLSLTRLLCISVSLAMAQERALERPLACSEALHRSISRCGLSHVYHMPATAGRSWKPPSSCRSRSFSFMKQTWLEVALPSRLFAPSSKSKRGSTPRPGTRSQRDLTPPLCRWEARCTCAEERKCTESPCARTVLLVEIQHSPLCHRVPLAVWEKGAWRFVPRAQETESL